jgi:hypothetical protein
LWVKKCVEKGALVYTPLVYKNPGGRRPGEECVLFFYLKSPDAANDNKRRTQFTEEDEQHLATWIAAKIPYKETGGRTGNRLYQQLCEMASSVLFSLLSFTNSHASPLIPSMPGSVGTLGNPGANATKKMPLALMR